MYVFVCEHVYICVFVHVWGVGVYNVCMCLCVNMCAFVCLYMCGVWGCPYQFLICVDIPILCAWSLKPTTYMHHT